MSLQCCHMCCHFADNFAIYFLGRLVPGSLLRNEVIACMFILTDKKKKKAWNKRKGKSPGGGEGDPDCSSLSLEWLLLGDISPSRSESCKKQWTQLDTANGWIRTWQGHFDEFTQWSCLHETEGTVDLGHEVLKVLLPQDGVFGQSRRRAKDLHHRRRHVNRLTGVRRFERRN